MLDAWIGAKCNGVVVGISSSDSPQTVHQIQTKETLYIFLIFCFKALNQFCQKKGEKSWQKKSLFHTKIDIRISTLSMAIFSHMCSK